MNLAHVNINVWDARHPLVFPFFNFEHYGRQLEVVPKSNIGLLKALRSFLNHKMEMIYY